MATEPNAGAHSQRPVEAGQFVESCPPVVSFVGLRGMVKLTDCSSAAPPIAEIKSWFGIPLLVTDMSLPEIDIDVSHWNQGPLPPPFGAETPFVLAW